MDVNCLLFDGFEILDLFGPVEALGMAADCRIKYYSMEGGPVAARQDARILTENAEGMAPYGVLLLPGGRGTRTLVNDGAFIAKLKTLAEKSAWCLTVCTGSGLLAKTGLLDGHEATSNKMAFEWAKSCGTEVKWKYRARWVVDGKYYTSSGVSAGTDMALGFLSDRFGAEAARQAVRNMEYRWESDPDNDPFAV